MLVDRACWLLAVATFSVDEITTYHFIKLSASKQIKIFVKIWDCVFFDAAPCLEAVSVEH